MNETRLAKSLQYRFLRKLSYTWMEPAMAPRTFVDNIDFLIPTPSDRGVLFACNHRSYFDFYLVLFCLYARGAMWPKSLYFPVRSEFFYDSPAGIALNYAVGGGVMYPPIFRNKCRELNADAVDRIVSKLSEPCTVVGVHPEGRRNLGDPYKLLPGQPGIGQIVLQANPMVVPVFVNGVDNSFVTAMKKSFQPHERAHSPIVVAFGRPVDYSEFARSKPRAALYKRCSDRIMEAIAECGERERQLRNDIMSGTIGEDHPGWMRSP